MAIIAPIPANDAQRLAALRGYGILDTPEEEQFDRITLLAAQICQAPIALISLVDGQRQWFKSRRGVGVRQTDRRVSFCAHAILGDETLVVGDTRSDPRFFDNDLVTGEPSIRAYAGAVLKTSSGFRLGTLCVIHKVPTLLNRQQVRQLESLAAITVDALELRRLLTQIL